MKSMVDHAAELRQALYELQAIFLQKVFALMSAVVAVPAFILMGIAALLWRASQWAEDQLDVLRGSAPSSEDETTQHPL